MSARIQCNRTSDEIAAVNHGHALLLTRPRPMRNGEYQICVPCARWVRADHAERNESTRSPVAGSMAK